jgi:glycosyltransferase involved in cell wall biosynthesis
VSSESRPGSVAIVITTYNHASFLAAAIRSSLAQSVSADEIIVVDDGSQDQPQRVTAEFPQVHLIRQANAGLSAARNTGWRAATSELVVFLDADDRLLPDALRVNRERLQAMPEAGFSYGGYVNVDAATGRSTLAPFTAATEGYATFLRKNAIGMHAAVMYRRDRLAEVGGFEDGLQACEDYDVLLRMALRYPLVYTAVPVAEYFHHRGNMSRDSAMMLHYALFVLGRQEAAATRLGALKAYREGLANLKRHYVRAWCLEFLAGVKTASMEASLIHQGASLARQAPLTVVGTPVRALRRLTLWVTGAIRSSRRV